MTSDHLASLTVSPSSSYRTEMRERTVKAVQLSSHSYLYVTLFTICAQAGGLVAAYLLGIMFHYDSLIKTHCSVPNFWPSISKATGDYLPGRYIWRFAVSLTTFPRVMDAILYYSFFATQNPVLFEQKRWYRWLNKINLLLMIVELFLFFTITFVSSKEHMDIHIWAWIAFLAFSMSHMITFLILFGSQCGQKVQTKSEKVSMKVRYMLLGVQVVAVMTFFYFGAVHIWHCQPYAFSFAAISECVIAASNLGFQGMQLVDFRALETVHRWACHSHHKLS